MELVDTESLVPQEHLLRKVGKAVDFRKLYEIVEPLYSEEDGRTSATLSEMGGRRGLRQSWPS